MFSLVVQNSTDVFALQDADRTIRYASPSVERMLGYRPEEMLGKTPADFLHPDDVERATGRWYEILSKPGADLAYTDLRNRHETTLAVSHPSP